MFVFVGANVRLHVKSLAGHLFRRGVECLAAASCRDGLSEDYAQALLKLAGLYAQPATTCTCYILVTRAFKLS